MTIPTATSPPFNPPLNVQCVRITRHRLDRRHRLVLVLSRQRKGKGEPESKFSWSNYRARKWFLPTRATIIRDQVAVVLSKVTALSIVPDFLRPRFYAETKRVRGKTPSLRYKADSLQMTGNFEEKTRKESCEVDVKLHVPCAQKRR